LSQIVVDLDETIWDWRMPLLRQLTFLFDHREYVYVRAPLLELLTAIGGGPLNAWTAGYGYRIDRICAKHRSLAAVLGWRRGDRAERLPTIVTRLDFLAGARHDVTLLTGARRPDGQSWVSQKIPGMPTAANKPIVDQARILLDDRQTNCARFVAAADGRAAIWLQGTSRDWNDAMPRRGLNPPPPRQWAQGVAEALTCIVEGQTGVFEVKAQPASATPTPVRVRLPHSRVYRDWIRPSRAVRDLLRATRPPAGD